MSLKSYLRLGTPSLKSFPEDLCSGFLRPEKIHRPQPDLNPRTLDLEGSTLSRDHRGRLSLITLPLVENSLTKIELDKKSSLEGGQSSSRAVVS